MTRRSKKVKHKNFYIAKAIALAIFPLVLLVLPATAFDSGPEMCLFTQLSGYHCPGCGMTRACMHMIHLDFGAAWQFNKVSFFVLPVLCGLLVADFMKTIRTYRAIRRSSIEQTS